jgi:hypothetical protein
LLVKLDLDPVAAAAADETRFRWVLAPVPRVTLADLALMARPFCGMVAFANSLCVLFDADVDVLVVVAVAVVADVVAEWLLEFW